MFTSIYICVFVCVCVCVCVFTKYGVRRMLGGNFTGLGRITGLCRIFMQNRNKVHGPSSYIKIHHMAPFIKITHKPWFSCKNVTNLHTFQHTLLRKHHCIHHDTQYYINILVKFYHTLLQMHACLNSITQFYLKHQSLYSITQFSINIQV